MFIAACAGVIALAGCGGRDTLVTTSEFGTEYKVSKARTAITPYAIDTLKEFTSTREKSLCIQHFDENFCSYRYSRFLGLAEEMALRESMAFAEKIKASDNIKAVTYVVEPDPQNPTSKQSPPQRFNCLNPKFDVRTIADIKEYLGLKPPGVKLPRNDQSIHGRLELEICRHWARFSWF